jgi:osmoprotectant transport system ATP-binding protein
LIEIKNLSKRFEDKWAVNDVSLTIPSHKFCVLIGPSGCGKTTTLRTINRLHTPSSGQIFIDEENVLELKVTELRRRIGYVIQTVGLFPHMTVAKNIGVIPRLLKWENKKIQRRVNEMLILVGLDPSEYASKKVYELSGGEAQRIGVARALAGDPPILLMDEPFGAVDPINRSLLQDAFLKIQRELKKTVVFVTHDMEEALKMGDLIAIMDEGKLVQFDSPLNILSCPKNDFVKSFFGSERILSRLSMLRVGDFVEDTRVESASFVDVSTDLREVFIRLLSSDTDSVLVKRKETVIGSMSLERLKKLSMEGYHE